jgi:hypothetical protein
MSGPNSPTAQDFASNPADTSTAPPLPEAQPHVHYGPNVDASIKSDLPPPEPTHGITHSDLDPTHGTDLSPVLHRRFSHATTFRTVEDFEDFELRPGWQPGAEPGMDPNKPDGGHASIPTLHAPTEITVIDFSQERIHTRHLDNHGIIQYLKEDPPSWMKCRWINVNGLSWDVIQVLGQYKKLHRLAIEDLMNTRNRTKADWYVPLSPSAL